LQRTADGTLTIKGAAKAAGEELERQHAQAAGAQVAGAQVAGAQVAGAQVAGAQVQAAPAGGGMGEQLQPLAQPAPFDVGGQQPLAQAAPDAGVGGAQAGAAVQAQVVEAAVPQAAGARGGRQQKRRASNSSEEELEESDQVEESEHTDGADEDSDQDEKTERAQRNCKSRAGAKRKRIESDVEEESDGEGEGVGEDHDGNEDRDSEAEMEAHLNDKSEESEDGEDDDEFTPEQMDGWQWPHFNPKRELGKEKTAKGINGEIWTVYSTRGGETLLEIARRKNLDLNTLIRRARETNPMFDDVREEEMADRKLNANSHIVVGWTPKQPSAKKKKNK
jgi:hypothetical protein